MKKYLYTDIDYVLSLESEVHPVRTSWGLLSRFDAKAMKVYNEILQKTNASIIISSGWKLHFSLADLQQIFFDFALADGYPIDVTPNLWGTKFKSLTQLEECRATEILEHVKQHNPDSWVAIDDLNLSKWISEDHFVHLTRCREGIKQSGKASQVIKLLNINDKPNNRS